MTLFIILTLFISLYLLYCLSLSKKEKFINYKFTQPNNNFNKLFDPINILLKKSYKDIVLPEIPIKKINLSQNNVDLNTKKIVLKAISSILKIISYKVKLNLKFLSIESVEKTVYNKEIFMFNVVFIVCMPNRYITRSLEYKFYFYYNNILPVEISTLQDNFIVKEKPKKISNPFKTIYKGAFFNPSFFQTYQPHEFIPLTFNAPNTD